MASCDSEGRAIASPTPGHVLGYDFAVLDNIMIFDADDITTPVGQISADWIQTLTPEFVDSFGVETYSSTN